MKATVSALYSLALDYSRKPLQNQALVDTIDPASDAFTSFLESLKRFPDGLDFKEYFDATQDELRLAAYLLVRQRLLSNPASDYQVLGLNSDATQEQMRQRYRLMMALFHPDRHSHRPEGGAPTTAPLHVGAAPRSDENDWMQQSATQINETYTRLKKGEPRNRTVTQQQARENTSPHVNPATPAKKPSAKRSFESRPDEWLYRTGIWQRHPKLLITGLVVVMVAAFLLLNYNGPTEQMLDQQTNDERLNTTPAKESTAEPNPALAYMLENSQQHDRMVSEILTEPVRRVPAEDAGIPPVRHPREPLRHPREPLRHPREPTRHPRESGDLNIAQNPDSGSSLGSARNDEGVRGDSNLTQDNFQPPPIPKREDPPGLLPPAPPTDASKMTSGLLENRHPGQSEIRHPGQSEIRHPGQSEIRHPGLDPGSIENSAAPRNDEFQGSPTNATEFSSTPLPDNIDLLLARYVMAYQAGEIPRMMQLFSVNRADGNSFTAKQIRDDFKSIFTTTAERKLQIRQRRWKRVDNDQVLIRFVASSSERSRSSQEWNKKVSLVVLKVLPDDLQPLITAFRQESLEPPDQHIRHSRGQRFAPAKPTLPPSMAVESGNPSSSGARE